MAQTNFNPDQNSTHADAVAAINNNANDAEARLSSIEAFNISAQFGHQSPTSVSGSLVFDASNGHNGNITLTEDTSLSIINATAGSSGVLIISQDAVGGWSLLSPYKVFTGLLSDVSLLLQNGGTIISISWYYDGTNYYLWVSNIV